MLNDIVKYLNENVKSAYLLRVSSNSFGHYIWIEPAIQSSNNGNFQFRHTLVDMENGKLYHNRTNFEVMLGDPDLLVKLVEYYKKTIS